MDHPLEPELESRSDNSQIHQAPDSSIQFIGKRPPLEAIKGIRKQVNLPLGGKGLSPVPITLEHHPATLQEDGNGIVLTSAGSVRGQ